MCSELTPRARIPDTRIPQLMQPCLLKPKFDGKTVLLEIITFTTVINTMINWSYSLRSRSPRSRSPWLCSRRSRPGLSGADRGVQDRPLVRLSHHQVSFSQCCHKGHNQQDHQDHQGHQCHQDYQGHEITVIIVLTLVVTINLSLIHPWLFIFPDLSLDNSNVLTQWFIEVFYGTTCFDLLALITCWLGP